MILRVYEAALYVDDLERATRFYRDVLGLAVVSAGPRLVAFSAGGGSHLLLFLRGATRSGVSTPGGDIPPHDGAGPLHMAFAVDSASLPELEARLTATGVPIESRVRWSRGGPSLYFRDPDGHSIELAVPGIWGESM